MLERRSARRERPRRRNAGGAGVQRGLQAGETRTGDTRQVRLGLRRVHPPVRNAAPGAELETLRSLWRCCGCSGRSAGSVTAVLAQLRIGLSEPWLTPALGQRDELGSSSEGLRPETGSGCRSASAPGKCHLFQRDSCSVPWPLHGISEVSSPIAL